MKPLSNQVIKGFLASFLAVGLLFAFSTQDAYAQEAIIEGQITNVATGEPLVGANVLIEGTTLGAATDIEGQYRISVPAAQVTGQDATIIARFVGFRAGRQTITLTADVHTLDFALRVDALRLEDIVITGLVGETERARLPFSVGRVTADDMQVQTHISAATLIQGKIAGATVVQGSGRPGAAPSFLLRGPTSIDAAGRNQEPMYIVDGIILSGSMVDLDALDIENIEVVKGAAAASRYGQRAANGVIQITTRRGHAMPDNEIRYRFRTDIGTSELEGRFNLTQAHQFLMTEDGSQFIDAEGNPCDWLDCESVVAANQRPRQLTDEQGNPIFDADGDPVMAGSTWSTFQIEEYPQTFDHVDRFFDPGMFIQNYFSAEGRSGRTNFNASISHLGEDGILPGIEGYERINFRLNLDQSVRPNLSLSGTTFISRSTDDLFTESQGNPLFNLTRMPAGSDLFARDEDGELFIRPDPHNENDNPLYELLNRQWDRQRTRLLGNLTTRYTPTDWMLLEADVSYDRMTLFDEDFYDRGYRTARPTPSVNDGMVYKRDRSEEAFNTSFTATFNQEFGSLNTRTSLRYLYEDQQWNDQWNWGSELGATGLPTLHNISGTPNVRSNQGAIRSAGYFLITNFDFDGKYIIDFLVRRDGSSLFGAEERWQNYWRAAGAYRITEEPWFDINGLDELKFRASYGTAGGRPNFSAQYETYSVLRGSMSPVSVGNRNLKPELASEIELGVELGLFDRFFLDVTYAETTVEDQILRVPLAGYSGFIHQWQNAGTLESNTLEISLDAQIVRQRDFNWSARLIYDRTRQEITQLDVPAFTYGVAGQAFDAAFYAREGEQLGTFYGFRWATDCSQIPGVSSDACANNFQTNDDGYLVYVGPGNDWTDGLWGNVGTVDGESFQWGSPVIAVEEDPITGEMTNFLPIGNTMPDYRISFSMNMDYRRLGLYFLFDAEQGFDVWNQPLQWATFQDYSGIMDQRGKPEGEQKPVAYYAALYNSLSPTNTHWVEDASYVKLRELSVHYTFSQGQLSSVGLGILRGATLRVTGRNLFTWTDYTGYDPEIGRAGGDVGSAAIARVDGYNYPNYRSYNFGIEFNF